MNFDGNVLCFWDSLTYGNVVNEDFHHLSGEVFEVCVTLDDLSAIVSDFDFYIDFFNLLTPVRNEFFKAVTVIDKVFGHLCIISTADESFDFIHIQFPNTLGQFRNTLFVGGNVFNDTVFLRLKVVTELDLPFQIVLVQILLGKSVQLVNDHLLQFVNRDEGADAGILCHVTVGALKIVLASIFRGAHHISAVGTASLPCKQTDGANVKRLCPFLDHLLYSVPKLTVNDGFVGSFHNVPLTFRPWLVLLGLVGNATVFALYHIADVDLVDQHIGNRKVFPKSAVLGGRLFVAESFQTFVFGWIGDASVVEHTGDCSFAVALGKECEHLANHSSGFLVDDQMPLLVGIFFVPVKSKGTNVESVFPSVFQNTADVVGHILQVPLVYKSVDLSGFLVALVGGIGIVHDADKANAPNGEQTVDVLFHQFQLTGEAGLCLAEDNIEFSCFRVLQQTVELRSASVCTGVVIVAVNTVNLPPLFDGVLHQHCFLILDATGIVGFCLLVSIFFG